MTDDDLTRLRDEVAGVLAEHRWQSVPDPIGLCSCGDSPATLENFGRWVEAYRAHLADALLPLLARKIAEADNDARLSEMEGKADSLTGQLISATAWDEGWAEGYDDARAGYQTRNPYRAALAEPTGPETAQNGPSAPISGPTSPRRVSADHRDATDPEETK